MAWKKNLQRALSISVIVLFSSSTTEGDTLSSYYFGDTLSTPDSAISESIDRGYALFIRQWQTPVTELTRNKSCVGCHEVPMPGGSGLAPASFVPAIASDLSPSGFHTIPADQDAMFSDRLILLRTPALFGLGLLENALCKGRPPCAEFSFGYRGRISSLENFVAFALDVELGVKRLDDKSPHGSSPTVSQENIQDIATFIRYLAPPPRGNAPALEGDHGLRTFLSIGCEACHSPINIEYTVSDGRSAEKLFPLGNFSLHRIRHNVGYPLRTPPLWGLSQTGPPYMHDGTAHSIAEAIHLHALEAEKAKNNFLALTSADRESLILFLRRL